MPKTFYKHQNRSKEAVEKSLELHQATPADLIIPPSHNFSSCSTEQACPSRRGRQSRSLNDIQYQSRMFLLYSSQKPCSRYSCTTTWHSTWTLQAFSELSRKPYLYSPGPRTGFLQFPAMTRAVALFGFLTVGCSLILPREPKSPSVFCFLPSRPCTFNAVLSTLLAVLDSGMVLSNEAWFQVRDPCFHVLFTRSTIEVLLVLCRTSRTSIPEFSCTISAALL